MNVLFLTLLGFESLNERNIYSDLLREFVKHGHHVYVISPSERRERVKTHLIQEEKTTILRLKIGNTQKTNIIEKGISTICIEFEFKKAIKKFFSNIHFHLILYSTPPITLVSAIEYVRKRDKAKTYLLLKDIFPQNAVDIGILSTTGIRGLLYKLFKKQEKRLYSISDHIGCMSQANVDYLLEYNPGINSDKVEVCPNCIEVIEKNVDWKEQETKRQEYGIPQNKIVFVYGGNLGKPQGISFMIECLKACEDIEEAYFVIIGDGTEFNTINDYINTAKPKNCQLIKRLPKKEFDLIVETCDVGMIFLDYRFTIPNFPSRLLSYMQAKKSVFAVTDPNTDIGQIITNGQFGWWVGSNNAMDFKSKIKKIIETKNLTEMGEKGYEYLKEHYTTELAYNRIVDKMKDKI